MRKLLNIAVLAAYLGKEGVTLELDAEALRIVGKSPRWRPAKKDGQPVKVSYSIPVVFSLQ